ncbi:MAG TPA: HD domain-containing protein [Firmicutes bacterium]|nr:HD domain-containing protein [Bacillota bacterium]
MNLEALRHKLASNLSPPRYEHSLRVMALACKLARHYQTPEEPVAIAALLHDVAREKNGAELLSLAENYGLTIESTDQKAPVLLHGKVGAEILRREWAITTPSILEAVAVHVTGAPRMGMISELTLLADFAEPGRTFYSAHIARELAFVHRPTALKYIFTQKIRYILDAGYLLHPLTIEARNQLLMGETGSE